MPKPARGEVRWVNGIAVARITLRGRRRPSFKLPTCRTQAEADARKEQLAVLAQRFRKAGVVDDPRTRPLLEMAAEKPAELMPHVMALADELAGGTLVLPKPTDNGPTFEQVAEDWTSGKLRERFPHQVPAVGEQYLQTARGRVKNGCFDGIRDVPVSKITREHCDAVMRALPLPPGKKQIGPSTRRQYAVLINRVLNLAELAGHIERNPLPKGWLPDAGTRKRFLILFPSEDAKLLGCSDVPLCWRLFQGFLHREGMRMGEATGLQLYEFDLVHGAVQLDENKTNHARRWKLSSGVAAALSLWAELRDAGPRDLVFVDENGGALREGHMAERIRDHLAAANLTRADLWSTGPNKGRFGTHGYRRSFATRNLALGGDRTDDWVRQRTGHTTDELLRYRQDARSLRELDLGDVQPLVLAVPELAEVLIEKIVAGLQALHAPVPWAINAHGLPRNKSGRVGLRFRI